MNKRIFIIASHDLIYYPPMQSLLTVFGENNLDVTFIGQNSNEEAQKKFELMGIKFESVYGGRGKSMLETHKIRSNYTRTLKAFLHSKQITNNDLIIYEYGDSAYFLHSLISQYRYLILFYEFINEKISWRLELLYRSFNFRQFVQGACAVIHCEYNRAQICQWLYGLKKTPYVLPNKPYPGLEGLNLDNAPTDILSRIEEIKKKVAGRKVILYQGVFSSSERRLEEFCQAMALLPQKYVLLAMGYGGYYDELKRRYESDSILFIPFIKSPYHLCVTRLATIGVLSYFPLNNTLAGVLNPIYCAPNKVFEYGMFGIPMLSNDIPGLSLIYSQYNCGRAIPSPISSEGVVKTITEINEKYEEIQNGSLNYYKSVDFKGSVERILEDLNMK